jgi:outer membrane protein OmpA-like peptidoglycan-associated protein
MNWFQRFLQILVLLVLLGLYNHGSLYAQADEQLYQVANEMYRFGDKRDALDVFIQAIQANPNNAKANYMAGKANIETVNKEEAIDYFLKAYELDNDIADDILYMIAYSYHLGYKLDNAIDYYNQYLKSVPLSSYSESQKISEINKTERRIYECSVAKSMLSRPLKTTIENLGDQINSVDEDYAPVVSGDQSLMFFTSRRKGSTGNNKDNDNEFYEDIYSSSQKDGIWEAPKNLGVPVNTDLHESAIGISADNKKLFLYIDNNQHKGDIFVSEIGKDGKWQAPKPLDKTINTEYIENAITFTQDGKTMYFSSDRPGGKGGMDIYKSILDKDNKWSKPINLGDTINTEHDDEAPFLSADGVTLYFSSRGHEGMGGFDIFTSTLDTVSNTWSLPRNMQYPINSTDDDIYFSITADNKYGYFSSVKPDGIGDVDIFKITIGETLLSEINSADSLTKKKIAKIDPKDSESAINESKSMAESGLIISKKSKKENAILPAQLQVFIVDKKTKKPLDAQIEIREESGNGELIKGEAKSGKYSYVFGNKERVRYIITVEKQGYLFKSTNAWIAEPSSEKQLLSFTFELDDIQVGAKGIMRNIFFEYDKFTLSEKSNPELNKLYDMLKSNASMKVEIDGHTDNTGNHLYNKSLSEKRAEAVVNWLVKKGIASSRFVTKGYGEDRPLASNDDEEEGRELNRRTEFVIIKK